MNTPFEPIRADRFTLPNGLRVVHHLDRTAPLVAINLWFHVGSKNEKPGRTGFAHLFEHLLFQGSEHVGANEHFEQVQRHGGVANGSTWYDRTNYYETLPSHAVELGFWLESDRLGFFEQAITQAKLDTQREVVKNERRTRFDNQPYGTWLERLTGAAYPADHFYSWPVIGSMEDLEAASLEEVREFFQTWYVPENAVLTVAGDVGLDEARRLCEKWFAPLARGTRPLPRPPSPPKPEVGERRIVVRDAVQLPRIFILWHSPSLRDRGWHASDLLATILGSGRSSRLHHRLVYDLGLARDAATFVLPLETTGQLHLQATCREGVEPERLEEAIDRELARIASEPVSDDELARGKARLETDLACGLDAIADRADRLGEFATWFDDPERINGEFAALDAVRSEEILEVASTRLTAGNRTVAWYLPATERGEGPA
jgi:predicted Zn-dependent peptidase